MAIEKTIFLKDLAETKELGKEISTFLRRGDLIYLKGDLGSGKTELVRAILEGLGFDGRVKSPSYSLFEQYSLKFTINHFDLYRFKSSQEWDDCGFNEFINENDVTIIEWPEKSQNTLPIPDIEFHFSYNDDISRNLIIKGKTERGIECIKSFG